MASKKRREFLKWTGTATAAAAFGPCLRSSARSQEAEAEAKEARFKLGMASYSFREFGLNLTLDMTKRLGLKHICFKSFHLPLGSSPDEIRSASIKTQEAGLDLYGCGVVYMTSEAEINRTFDYAKTAGMRVIIGVPNHELLSAVNDGVKKYNIQLAIHNHGPGDELYPTPGSVYERIAGLDPRVGLCLDVGHTQRSGVDPAETVLKFSDRLLDVHIKDVTESSPAGGPVEIGRGVVDIPSVLKALVRIGYRGMVSIEYEKDGRDPLPGAAESVGYVRGVLSML